MKIMLQIDVTVAIAEADAFEESDEKARGRHHSAEVQKNFLVGLRARVP